MSCLNLPLQVAMLGESQLISVKPSRFVSAGNTEGSLSDPVTTEPTFCVGRWCLLLAKVNLQAS